MLSKLLIRFVENDLVLAVLLHTGFQVVALDDPSDAAKVFVGIHMGSSPRLLIHGEKGFHIAVAAARQGSHKHIGRDDLAGVRVDDSGGITCPVHLYNLTGLVIQVNGGVRLGQIVGVILVELGGLVRDLSRRPALVAVFQPDQIQSNAATLEFLVNIGVVGLRGAGRKQTL